MTFEELRITYQNDEHMARDLFRQLVVAEAAARSPKHIGCALKTNWRRQCRAA